MKPRDADVPMTTNKGTKKTSSSQTSSFGVSKREGHDSSKYYDTKMYQGIPRESDVGDPQEFPEFLRDSLICGDSRDMSMIPPNSVQLMVTSPPYNVTVSYTHLTLPTNREV